MEKRFKSLSLFEFQERFPDEESCVKYLAELKWWAGYRCVKCGHDKYCQGIEKYDRQCTKCNRLETATSGTLFHHCKLPLLKVFYIVYYVSTGKSSISSSAPRRQLELRQKTCWLFKQKVMRGMASSGNHPMDGKVDVDETYVGGQDEKALGRNEGRKQIMVVAVERKGKGVSRIYGRVVETATRENLKRFMLDHIDAGAEVRTD